MKSRTILISLIATIALIFLLNSSNANATCCRFNDAKQTYFDLGNWNQASLFCSKMGLLTGLGSSFSDSSCIDLNIPSTACDGWTQCNTDIPAPGNNNNGGSSSSSSFSSSNGCNENWKCDEFSSCLSSNVKTRNCIDLNNCGKIKNKPSTQETCNYISLQDSSSEDLSTGNSIQENTAIKQNKLNFFQLLMQQLTGAAIGPQVATFAVLTPLVLILVIIFTVISFKKKKKEKGD